MYKNNNRGYLGEDFRIFSLKDDAGVDIGYHHHDFYKIVFFISGKAQYSVEGKVYNLKPWDILLINKHEIHKCVADKSEPYERIVIWLRDDIEEKDKYFKDMTNCFKHINDDGTHLLRLKENSCNTVKNLMTKIVKYNNSKLSYDIALKNSFLIQFLVIVNKSYSKNNSRDINKDIFYDETTEQLISYINNNLNKSLKIEELSEELGLSKHYLMRRFKNQTGYSIHNYIVQKRLIYALELMRHNTCMYEVSEQVGFNDYSTFVRAFKRNYNISPKKYLEGNGKVDTFNLID